LPDIGILTDGNKETQIEGNVGWSPSFYCPGYSVSSTRGVPARFVPYYEKPLLGILAVLEIGLDAIRRECPHFREWLARLEKRTT